MPRKLNYEVLETDEKVVEQKVSVPRKIRIVVKTFKNGGYLWLPKEWCGKTVVVAVED